MPKVPTGTYPFATLVGGDRYASAGELARLDDEGPTALGEGLMRRLSAGLAERGVVVGDADGSSSGGWETALERDGARFWLTVGCLGAPDERWLVTVDERRTLLGALFSRGRPEQLRPLLEILHEVLRSTDGIRDVRWYAPEDWMSGREDRWHPGPLATT